jgi:malonate transporter
LVTELAGILTPIFGVILLGFLAVKFRVLEEAGVKGLVTFVFNFAVPVFLFQSLAKTELPEEFHPAFLVAYYGATFTIYAVAMAIGRFLFHRPLDHQAIFGMSGAFSNTVFMGIPIVITTLGPEAALPLLLIITFHGATYFPITTILIKVGQGKDVSAARQARSIMGELVGNPIILGLGLGLGMNLTGLDLPGPLDALATLLGGAAVPCALFAMGASLASYPLTGDITPALCLIPLKLVAHPLLTWIIAVPILGLEGIWVSVAVVLAGCPTGVMPYMFAARYDAAPGVAARTVLLTTLASVGTVSLILYLVQAGF